ncbi:MAG TPA: GxxExxY protein [Acidobacteriota bacterium]|nr:GxxExxY protein [Acidobacteriota bacterium]
MNSRKINDITESIIGSAIQVHKTLGPGLLESTYEACLVSELSERRFKLKQQQPIPVVYKNTKLECGYRIDLIVEELVIVKLKAIEAIKPIHMAQVLSYLKLSGLSVGLLINFNVAVLTHGVRRIVNNFQELSATSAISAVSKKGDKYGS